MNDDVSMYLIHPAMKPWLDEFLESRGIEVRRTPWLDDDDPDAIPVYLLAPKEVRRG